jgi:hypothetical protein
MFNLIEVFVKGKKREMEGRKILIKAKRSFVTKCGL